MLNNGKAGSIAASGGTLDIDGDVYIGSAGTGTFTQGGGTFIVEDYNYLYVGYGTGASGGYTMTGGELQAYGVFVGYYDGTGVFNQTDGLCGLNSISIGRWGVAQGTYNMSGGTLAVDEYLNVGNGTRDDEDSGRLFSTGGAIIAIADAPPVPEPCTLALLTAGALALSALSANANNANRTKHKRRPSKNGRVWKSPNSSPGRSRLT